MSKRVAAFVEDFAHRQIIGALIERVASDLGVHLTDVQWRNARGGYGRTIAEFKTYLRDMHRQGGWPDFVIVATDSNCKGWNARVDEIPVSESPIPVVMAVPDPHIERWLLLDGAAFRQALGRGCKAPDRKCSRDRYKGLLVQAVIDAGIYPNLGGIEFADDIVRVMDLDSARRLDRSLDRFLNELSMKLRTP